MNLWIVISICIVVWAALPEGTFELSQERRVAILILWAFGSLALSLINLTFGNGA